jgi:hypothetical protein
MNNDKKVQELIRVIDATLNNINPDGLTIGQNCLLTINFLNSVPNINNFISSEFQTLINDEVKKTQDKKNVREHVKKILIYPQKIYSPMSDVKMDDTIIKKINVYADKCPFHINIVNGKVYASCIMDSEYSLTSIAYDLTHDKLEDNVIKNTEPCHITLINSNIVADIGLYEVKKFIYEQEKYDVFFISTGKIKTTISEDWTLFSRCYVIEIESKFIQSFLKDFNKQFNLTIKIVPHITFAIKPRDLFNKF